MVGLIVFGGFLPQNSGVASNRDLYAGGINTATEFLSSYLTKQLADYISGVDIQFGYNNVQQYDKLSTASTTYQQFRLRGSKDFLDGRLSLSGGVNLESGLILQTSDFLGGDIIVDYSLTNDKRLRIRVSGVRDQVLDGRVRTKPAVGLRYRDDFDNFGELFKKKK